MKELLKSFVLAVLGPKMGLKVRRYYLAREILRKEGSEEVEYRVLRRFLHSGDTAIDIGANVGAYTKEISNLVGENGRVFSFEPVAENFVILETVVRKARLDNVILSRAAIGSKPGKCDIVIPTMDGYTGYYWAHLSDSEESGQRESVDVRTLDELASGGVIDNTVFIKCDVEGGELDVVRGAKDFLADQRPGWLMEVSKKTSDEVFLLFHSLGYSAYVYDGRMIETEGYRDKEFSNYFFFHSDSLVWDRVKSL